MAEPRLHPPHTIRPAKLCNARVIDIPVWPKPPPLSPHGFGHSADPAAPPLPGPPPIPHEPRHAASLDGARTLIAAGRWDLAYRLRRVLEADGALVVGQPATDREARRLLAGGHIDLAFVQLELRDGDGYPLLAYMARSGVASIAVAEKGYAGPVPSTLAAVLPEHFMREDLVDAARHALSGVLAA